MNLIINYRILPIMLNSSQVVNQNQYNLEKKLLVKDTISEVIQK